jgi:Kef-type K+ transport system membrane component KefB
MSGASVAEVGTIGLLGVFFAGRERSAAISALLLCAVAILAVLLLAVLRYTLRWTAGQRIFDRLDETSAQARVRFSVMILVAAAALAMQFGFEGILGTFVAGIVVGIVMRGDRFEQALNAKLLAGLVSAIVLPGAATALLGGAKEHDAEAESEEEQLTRPVGSP